MPEDVTRDFGAYLKDARERSGITLRAIATNTKISMPSLEALERNDVSRLPGGIFLRAFVRAYAKEVGLDTEDTVRRFVSRFPDAAAVDELTVHEPVQDRTMLGDEPGASRTWRIAAWSLPFVLLIVYVAFGGRLTWLRDQFRSTARPADAQVEQAPPSSETPVLTTPAGPPPADPGAGVNPGSGLPAAAGGDAAAASATGGAPGAAPATITAPATEGRFTMTLASRARCWVTVRSDGQIVFSGTMQPGDRQDLVLGGRVSLTVGNAGAMAVDLDGKPARALGGDGEVKTIRLTAQTLKDFLEAR
jgi:cytoskeleton protein RodZ